MKATAACLIVGWVACGLALPGLTPFESESSRAGSQRRPEAIDRVVPNAISLQRISHQTSPRTYWANTLGRYLGDHLGAAAADPSKPVPLSLVQNNSYVATIGIGEGKVNVIVDTGSADTWVLQKNYTCYGYNSRGVRVKAPVWRFVILSRPS